MMLWGRDPNWIPRVPVLAPRPLPARPPPPSAPVRRTKLPPCPVCGKPYDPHTLTGRQRGRQQRSRKGSCSRACSMKLAWNRRRLAGALRAAGQE